MNAPTPAQLAAQAETHAIQAFHLWAVLPFEHPLAASMLRMKENWYAIAAGWREQAKNN